ncbi:MAG TPA: hypothetical protein PKK56_00045 [archaeon]|nr:hypothetical protein [archaeon]
MATKDAFNKYVKNYKLVLAYSVLFIFLLFIIDPLFKMYGGGINLTYNIFGTNFLAIVLTLISVLLLIFVFSLIQAALIHKVTDDYFVGRRIHLQEIKTSFLKLFKFNGITFLLIYIVSLILYDLFLLNNIIVSLIFFGIALLLWFTPQAIVIEKDNVGVSMLFSIKYLKNWKDALLVFVTTFILTFISILLDVVIGGIVGPILSILFFTLFVIPYIEILKTDLYLSKYRLLKPMGRR